MKRKHERTIRETLRNYATYWNVSTSEINRSAIDGLVGSYVRKAEEAKVIDSNEKGKLFAYYNSMKEIKDGE